MKLLIMRLIWRWKGWRYRRKQRAWKKANNIPYKRWKGVYRDK